MMGISGMPRWLVRRCIFPVLMVGLWIFSSGAMASHVLELSLQGAIGPASADYVVRGIARGQHAELILIQLDTPGGLDKSMREIVQAILTSKRPIVVYVAPNGARAMSAGTYLLYASTVAAMAPGTHMGAASPVSLAAGMDKVEKKSNQKTVLETKASNDAIAYIRMLAQVRGRNVEFAEKAARDAATLTASEALEAGVINLVAKNRDDLLKQLDGLTVNQDSRPIKLEIPNVQVERLQPDWRMRLLWVITDPTIAYMLLLLGVYGIFFELVNPGFIAPGVIGGVSILVALYALQLLPVNYAGLALIFLGVMFVIAEVYVQGFGALGLGGTVAFVIGSILLIDTGHEAFQIALPSIFAMALVNVLFFGLLLSMVIRARRKPVLHGVEILIGAHGKTVGPVNPQGQAVINGEIWSVSSSHRIEDRRLIEVVGVNGLILVVREIQGE